MASFILGLFGGFIAWVGTMIIGQPLYTYRSLRAEAARLVSFYERARSGEPTIDELLTSGERDEAWRTERRRAYQTCGTQFLALAAANAMLTAILHRFRRYPETAGQALLTLGDLKLQSEAAHHIQQQLISALKLNLTPQ